MAWSGAEECGHGTPRALRQTLRVVAVGRDRVVLEGNRQSACSHCAARSGCGTAALTEISGGGRLRLDLPRTKTVVRPGDEVVVAMPAAAFLGVAALAYLLPPAAMVIVSGVLSALGWSELAVALSSLLVLAVSLVPLVRAERRGRIKGELRIETVVASENAGRDAT